MRTLRIVKSDPQREAYYEAEDQFHTDVALPTRQARSIIRDVCALYSLPRVPFHQAESTTRFAGAAEKTPRGYRIILYCKQCLTIHFVLHELAHIVVMERFPEAKDHGKEFAAVVAWLFDHYRVIPEDALRVVYRRYGVRALSHVEAHPHTLDARKRL